MATALYIGRFQPIHKAHVEIIRNILKENDKVIIGIGSSQHANHNKNPFSADERKSMVEKSLQQEFIHEYEIFLIPDINDDNKWVDYVKSIVPIFDSVYTMNPLVRRLFSEKKIKVIWLDEIAGYSSTEVRRRMMNGENWQELVPYVVVGKISRINGVERVNKCCR